MHVYYILMRCMHDLTIAASQQKIPVTRALATIYILLIMAV